MSATCKCARCRPRATKVCNRCGKRKRVNAFYAAAGNTDGLRKDCKTCYRELYYASGKKAANLADQLRRGDQLKNVGNHHSGMASLKAQLGDPRPKGMTLSLVNWESPDTYDGSDARANRPRGPYRLSTNPDDYCWESIADNRRRDAARKAAA